MTARANGRTSFSCATNARRSRSARPHARESRRDGTSSPATHASLSRRDARATARPRAMSRAQTDASTRRLPRERARGRSSVVRDDVVVVVDAAGRGRWDGARQIFYASSSMDAPSVVRPRRSVAGRSKTRRGARARRERRRMSGDWRRCCRETPSGRRVVVRGESALEKD